MLIHSIAFPLDFEGRAVGGFGRLSDNQSALCQILKCKSRDGPIFRPGTAFCLDDDIVRIIGWPEVPSTSNLRM
jgi:hypothetical protein